MGRVSRGKAVSVRPLSAIVAFHLNVETTVKSLIVAAVLIVHPVSALAEQGTAKFHVSVKKDGREIASPSFVAKVGESASIRVGDGLSLEALAKPAQPDGRAWTQIRITYFEDEGSKFVQEMHLRHDPGSGGGTFEYTDAANRRYFVQVVR